MSLAAPTLDWAPVQKSRPRITTEQATAIVRQCLDPALTVTRVRKLHGGMVHRVCEFVTDGEPASVVAKLNFPDKADVFERECHILEWYRQHTAFPVPEPLARVQPTDAFRGTGLLLERIHGPNLSDARLSPTGFRRIQHELAHHVAELHAHRRPTYGPALEPTGPARWIDVFRPTFQREFLAVRDMLSSPCRRVVAHVLDHLEAWIPEAPDPGPTLVHGDLWATNILVDDRHPDQPRILAFIDCGASYCDPEYELAYLRIFRTAHDEFFQRYARRHPLRPGFDRRCRVYWLNTMMLHVRMFGDQYIQACEDLAEQLRRLA